jgi:lipopolysaccharide cholinephosphotransferase
MDKRLMTDLEKKALLVEMLKKLDTFFAKNNITYYLAYGTLLGAVRHKGFIPWDDDVDLLVPRADVVKLIHLCENKKEELAALNLEIIEYGANKKDYYKRFKFADTRTVMEEFGEERSAVFVDIFPADRVADRKLGNTLQYIASAVNLLYTRGFRSGTGGVIGLTEKVLLALPKKLRPALRCASEALIRRWNGREDLKWFSPSTIVSAKRYYPSDLFHDMKTISFCGKEYACAADTDTFLRVDYGDYMQLPPEEERVWKHHPICIDFEKNYEEIDKT